MGKALILIAITAAAAFCSCALFSPADVVNNITWSSGAASSAAVIATNVSHLNWSNYQAANMTNLMAFSNAALSYDATNGYYISNIAVTNGTNYFRWTVITNVTVTDTMTVIGGNDTNYTATNYSLITNYYFVNCFCTTNCFGTSYSNISYIRAGNQVFITNNSGATGVIIIPASIEGWPVTAILAGAFQSCSGLSCVIMNDSLVTDIGAGAFDHCTGLTNISLDVPLACIEYGSFDMCTSLKNIIIPDNVTDIGSMAFDNCTGLTNVVLGNSLFKIEDSAFYLCLDLSNISIPDSVISIGPKAFYECYFTNVVLGGSLTSIGNYAFCYCYGIPNIIMPNTMSSIGGYAFYHNFSLTNVTFSNSNCSIGGSALSGEHSGFTVTAPSNGTVQDYCASNGITFVGF